MGSMDILNGMQNSYDATCSNLFVKGLPVSIDEQTLAEVFSKFGDIKGCHLLPTSQSETTKVGIVNLSTAAQARDAVNALHGAPTDQGVLEVIAGPGPPTAPGRQQTPCDNLYIRNLPSTWGEQELRDMFSPFGLVQESRILHRGDEFRGAGALVRMNNIEAASRAISALNGHIPRSQLGETLTNQPLLVRYADSPEEKARKQARKEQMVVRVHRSLDLPSVSVREDSGGVRRSSLPSSFHALGPSGLRDLSGSFAASTSLFQDPVQAEASLEALLSNLVASTHTSNTSNEDSLPLGNSSLSFNRFGSPTDGLSQPPPPPLASCASLYVKNLPPETDKLWLYERFAPHGAILSVKVLQDENSLRCRGVGFVNYTEPQGALNAIQSVNGMRVADKHLHVSLQTNRTKA